MITRGRSKQIIRWAIIAFAACIVVGYALFAFRDISRGPVITISEPVNGETYASSTVILKGTAVRAQELTLNGKPMLIDENSNFSEVIVLSPGYNVATVEAKDKFGHTAVTHLELIKK